MDPDTKIGKRILEQGIPEEGSMVGTYNNPINTVHKIGLCLQATGMSRSVLIRRADKSIDCASR